MHEISIMQSALEIAEESAQKAGGTAIKRICLQVGLLSGVVPEALEFAFDVLKKGTMAEGASLEVDRLPGGFLCSNCNQEIHLQELKFECPDCGGRLVIEEGAATLELTHLEIV